MTATIPVVVTVEDGPAEPPADLLVKRLVMAQGLFPEERLFVPPLPAEPRPGGHVKHCEAYPGLLCVEAECGTCDLDEDEPRDDGEEGE